MNSISPPAARLARVDCMKSNGCIVTFSELLKLESVTYLSNTLPISYGAGAR